MLAMSSKTQYLFKRMQCERRWIIRVAESNIVESSNLPDLKQSFVHRLSNLAHPSSQEATSFRSPLMFRLFFFAYLQVGHILFGLLSQRILCKNRNAKDDVTSPGKSLMIPDTPVRSRYH